MSRMRWLIVVLIIAGLSACAPVKVSQDYDQSIDFSKYKTFAWLSDVQDKTGDIRIDNPLIDSRVRAAINNTLTSKGYEKASSDSSDFYVKYHLSLKRKLSTESINTSIGYGRYGRRGGVGVGFGTGAGVREYEQGTLVIDILDAKSRQLLWRGSATRQVKENPSPEQTTDTINKAVAEILAQFPPK